MEGVPINIETVASREAHGTTLRLINLRRAFDESELDKLARSIVLLSDPFESTTTFKPRLEAPGFNRLEKLVQESYIAEAHWKLVAELSSDGSGTARVVDWKGDALWSAPSTEWRESRKRDGSSPTYDAPPTTFELYSFLLQQEHFSTRGSQARVADVKQWLATFGGVHFYHRRFRVPPYGDPGHDWLDMNLRRSRSPEERPSTNNSVGRIVVEDPEGILAQKTDRVPQGTEEPADQTRAGRHVQLR